MSSSLPFARLRRPSRPRGLKLAAALMISAALTLALASQLLLPGFVQARMADRLSSRLGVVRSLDISATPGVKLLWGDADQVDVHLGTVDAAALAGGDGRLAEVSELQAEIDELTTKLIDVKDVQLRKSGGTFDADLVVDRERLGQGPAGGLDLEVASDGSLYLVPGGGRLRLQITTADGAVVARSDGASLLGSLVGSRTLFAPEHLNFDGLHATSAGSEVRVELSGRVVS